MSTKFRQSFVTVCNDCRRSRRSQQSSAVLFYKDYTVRHAVCTNGHTTSHILSTSGKVSSQHTNGNHLHEKKSLLVNNASVPKIETPMDVIKPGLPDGLI
jgi:hypothetical protein